MSAVHVDVSAARRLGRRQLAILQWLAARGGQHLILKATDQLGGWDWKDAAGPLAALRKRDLITGGQDTGSFVSLTDAGRAALAACERAS